MSATTENNQASGEIRPPTFTDAQYQAFAATTILGIAPVGMFSLISTLADYISALIALEATEAEQAALDANYAAELSNQENAQLEHDQYVIEHIPPADFEEGQTQSSYEQANPPPAGGWDYSGAGISWSGVNSKNGLTQDQADQFNTASQNASMEAQNQLQVDQTSYNNYIAQPQGAASSESQAASLLSSSMTTILQNLSALMQVGENTAAAIRSN